MGGFGPIPTGVVVRETAGPEWNISIQAASTAVAMHRTPIVIAGGPATSFRTRNVIVGGLKMLVFKQLRQCDMAAKSPTFAGDPFSSRVVPTVMKDYIVWLHFS